MVVEGGNVLHHVKGRGNCHSGVNMSREMPGFPRMLPHRVSCGRELQRAKTRRRVVVAESRSGCGRRSALASCCVSTRRSRRISISSARNDAISPPHSTSPKHRSTTNTSVYFRRRPKLMPHRTRGQSNLTKSASRGAHSPVRGHPRGLKVVPLNSWGRVSY